MDSVDKILGRYEARRSARRQWESHWQELAELMLPRRADFTAATTAGAKRTHAQFDSVPMLAGRGLASAVEGLLTPKTERWVGVRPRDKDLMDDEESKRWIEEADDSLWDALYDPKAGFVKAMAEAYLDLVTLGTAIVFIGERQDKRGLTFRALHLRDTYIGVNAEGRVDQMFLIERLTAKQAANKFTRDKLGQATKEILAADGPDKVEKKLEFLQVVEPREDRDGRLGDVGNMPFSATTIDVGSNHLIDEGGYHDFPFSAMRWDTSSGEDYGRSPGMLALPDSKTLMQMGKTLLEASHKAVDPPWFAPSDSIASAPRTFPGGITYYDAEALQGSGIRNPIFPAVSRGNFPIAYEQQRDLRDQVWNAFFKNVLNLPVQGPAMTATEIVERKQEFIRTIGPTLGRLEPDGPAVIVERSFGIMLRAGALPEMPEKLARSGVKFRYTSPIERVIKQIDGLKGLAALESLGPIVQIDPGALDNFDTDVVTREIAKQNMPLAWLRPTRDVLEGRARRAEAQAEQAEAEAAAQAVQQGADLVGKVPGLGEALNDPANDDDGDEDPLDLADVI